MKYKIKDNQTGEIIEVDETELASYGLQAPTAQAQQPTSPQLKMDDLFKGYVIAQMSGDTRTAGQLKQLMDTQKSYEEYQAVVGEGGLDEQTAKARRVIDQFEEIYFGDPSTDEPLSYAIPGKTGGRLAGPLAELKQKITPTTPGSREERLREYTALVDSSLAQMAKAAGDVGNIALVEQLLQKKALPISGDTTSEAIGKFINIREKLGMPENERLNELARVHRPTRADLKKAEDEYNHFQELVKEQGISKETENFLVTNEINIPTNIKIRQGKKTTIMADTDTIRGRAQQAFGTSEGREEIMKSISDTLTGQSIKEQTGIDLRSIPVLNILLGMSGGLHRQAASGPFQLTGGALTGDPTDIAVGGVKTAATLAAPQAATPIPMAIASLLGGGVKYLEDGDVAAGMGEGAMSAAQAQGFLRLVGKTPIGGMVKKIIRPRQVAAEKAKSAAESYGKAGISIKPDSVAQKTAKLILQKKEWLPEGAENALGKIASGKNFSPSELIETMPRIREQARTLTNNPLRSTEGQMFEEVYKKLMKQTSEALPSVHKEVTNIAKTFPKPTRELEPLQRLLHRYAPGAITGLAAGGLGMLGLNKFLGRGGGGGGE